MLTLVTIQEMVAAPQHLQLQHSPLGSLRHEILQSAQPRKLILITHEEESRAPLACPMLQEGLPARVGPEEHSTERAERKPNADQGGDLNEEDNKIVQ